ncbi:MAG: Holliday junction branch migration protein RuvA [Acidobacteria bacterium]|nr:Holliday junction branch migration protein RuvA [Acidobacteriota bacterium]
MIAHLRGILLEKHPHQAIVDCHGVGYDVAIPVSTYTRLPDAGAEVRLRIYTSVREDAIQLFGFFSVEEKQLFEKLITVSGIGAKLALTALSGLPTADLAAAIRGGEVTMLTRIPGVGKKTAERMVLELRDKIDAVAGAGAKPLVSAAPVSELEADIISALVNLGSPRPAAEAAVRKARATVPGEEFEPLFRRSLELVR